MKRILLIGAGRSATVLIKYLAQYTQQESFEVLVADRDLSLVENKVKGLDGFKAIQLNAMDADERKPLIQSADLVISMLPASMHVPIITDCIEYETNALTPSYISPEMEALHEKAVRKGVYVMNEMGLDPGIDHMSAMAVMDELRDEGKEITGFESFCGGLVAPENDNNPWNYKFTWNPRNVVLAGQGGVVKFLHNGKYKYIPYHRLFSRTERIDMQEFGMYEGYANRDSLKYQSIYGLENAHTIFRGTLRKPGFSKAWNLLVQLGVTDDTFVMANLEGKTYREFFNSFLAYSKTDSVELKMKYYLNLQQDDEDLYHKLEWLGCFSDEKITLKEGTPAQVLQYILEKKWSMQSTDKDMCVMWHKFYYSDGKTEKIKTSTMKVIGENAEMSSMSKTVGLPLGIFARKALQGKFNLRGVLMPIMKEVYVPVLEELAKEGIEFIEKDL